MTAPLMLDIDNRLYRVVPSFNLLLDIEEEMGSLPRLRQIFLAVNGRWLTW